MLREDLADAVEIVKNVLSQPIAVPGLEEEISLLEAAQRFNPSHPGTSELSKMLHALVLYPDSTRLMLRELELTANSLSPA